MNKFKPRVPTEITNFEKHPAINKIYKQAMGILGLLILSSLAVGVIIGGIDFVRNKTHLSFPHLSFPHLSFLHINLGKLSETPGDYLDIQAKKVSTEKQSKLSEALADRITKQGELPEHSPLNLGILGESQDSNNKTMAELLENLSCELGSTETLGTIKTLRENRELLKQMEPLTQSDNSEVAKTALQKIVSIKSENEELQTHLRKSLNKEGFQFTEAQIKALCTAPNAEDTLSIISAFQSLKTISMEMEQRLRTFPSSDHALRYYAAHTALLMALDKIQKNGIKRITTLYIPQTDKIAMSAQKNIDDAKKIRETNLLNSSSEEGLSTSQLNTLTFNQQSCIKTIALSMKTHDKLVSNLIILQKSNNKLERSIKISKNSLMTMLLHKESIKLDTEQLKAFEEIQALTLPEMIAINFSDPERPTVQNQ